MQLVSVCRMIERDSLFGNLNAVGEYLKLEIF